MNMNVLDLNKFSVKGNSEDAQGIELQYNICQGVNINIPVQQMAQAAVGNLKDAAEKKMYEIADAEDEYY